MSDSLQAPGSAAAPAPLSRAFSVWLDLLRFAAAFMVVVFHIKTLGVGPEAFRARVPDRGHDFVIVFFVLSGYVIAYTADRKRAEGLRGFALDRLARVYSVALPVLVFCTVLALTVPRWMDPNGYWTVENDHALALLPLNALFLGQLWWTRLMPFADYPYWSLTYEVWYYAIFGIFTFVVGRKRWLLMAVLMTIMGPKMLLLMPCWIAGAAAYRWRGAVKLSPAMALVVAFVAPAVLAIALSKSGFGHASAAWSAAFFNPATVELLDVSKTFLTDYGLALIVAIHLYGMHGVKAFWPAGLERVVRAAAAMSFTLYLLHHPLLSLTAAVFDERRQGLAALLCALVGVPALCWAVAQVTEERRYLLRRWLASRRWPTLGRTSGVAR